MLKEARLESLSCDLTISPFFRLTARQSTTIPQRLSVMVHPIRTSAETLQEKLAGLVSVGQFSVDCVGLSGGVAPHLRLGLICEAEGFTIDQTLEALSQLGHTLVGDA